MSILIKGMEMEMPRNCWECEFNKSTLDRMDFCTLTNKQYNWGLSERPSDCPLIELQPHGRLIDADALLKLLDSCMFPSDMVTTRAVSMATNWIKEAPTVIPADKDGEA